MASMAHMLLCPICRTYHLAQTYGQYQKYSEKIVNRSKLELIWFIGEGVMVFSGFSFVCGVNVSVFKANLENNQNTNLCSKI